MSNQRRRQTRRATTFRESGVSKSRRNSISKSHRNLNNDRRSSDTSTPKGPYRRRLNKSIPELSLLTTLSDQHMFSPAQTPTIKSETMFPPSMTAFESLSQSQFHLGDHPTLDSQVMNSLSNAEIPAYHPGPQRDSYTSHDSQHPSPTQAEGALAQSTPHHNPENGAPSMSQSASSLGNEHLQQQQKQQPHQAQQHNFDFSSTSTPYSSEFFDNNPLHVVSSAAFDDHQLNFEPASFSSTTPFNISGDSHAFPTGAF